MAMYETLEGTVRQAFYCSVVLFKAYCFIVTFFYTLYSVPCQASHPSGSTLSPRLKCIHIAACIVHSAHYYEGISSPLMCDILQAHSHIQFFDCLQYANTEGEGLGDVVGDMW